VKWRGYYRTSLELAKSLEDTEALDRWEAYMKDYWDDENYLLEGFRRPTPLSAERRGVL
jgi:hypothetical protein